MAISTNAAEQSKATKFTINTVKQLLDYCALHPGAKIEYKKSDTILNIHSAASYLAAPKPKICAAGLLFLG